MKTVTVQPGTMQTASLSPLPSDSRKLMPAPATANPATITTITTVKSCGAAAAGQARAADAIGVRTAQPVQVASASASDADAGRSGPGVAAKPPRGGWMIQVGAFDDENEAKQRLSAAQSKAKDQLGKADPVHRTGRQGRQDALPRALCRARQDPGGNRLQISQAQRYPCMLLKN